MASSAPFSLPLNSIWEASENEWMQTSSQHTWLIDQANFIINKCVIIFYITLFFRELGVALARNINE